MKSRKALNHRTFGAQVGELGYMLCRLVPSWWNLGCIILCKVCCGCCLVIQKVLQRQRRHPSSFQNMVPEPLRRLAMWVTTLLALPGVAVPRELRSLSDICDVTWPILDDSDVTLLHSKKFDFEILVEQEQECSNSHTFPSQAMLAPETATVTSTTMTTVTWTTVTQTVSQTSTTDTTHSTVTTTTQTVTTVTWSTTLTSYERGQLPILKQNFKDVIKADGKLLVKDLMSWLMTRLGTLFIALTIATPLLILILYRCSRRCQKCTARLRQMEFRGCTVFILLVTFLLAAGGSLILGFTILDSVQVTIKEVQDFYLKGAFLEHWFLCWWKLVRMENWCRVKLNFTWNKREILRSTDMSTCRHVQVLSKAFCKISSMKPPRSRCNWWPLNADSSWMPLCVTPRMTNSCCIA